MKVKTAGELQDTPPRDPAGTHNLRGGSNGAQVFRWVCGLNAVNLQATAGGLLR